MENRRYLITVIASTSVLAWTMRAADADFRKPLFRWVHNPLPCPRTARRLLQPSYGRMREIYCIYSATLSDGHNKICCLPARQGINIVWSVNILFQRKLPQKLAFFLIRIITDKKQATT
jgi:hypothetical protein